MHDGRCANGECPVIWTDENYCKMQRVDAYFFFVNGKKISVFKNIWVRADKT